MGAFKGGDFYRFLSLSLFPEASPVTSKFSFFYVHRPFLLVNI